MNSYVASLVYSESLIGGIPQILGNTPSYVAIAIYFYSNHMKLHYLYYFILCESIGYAHKHTLETSVNFIVNTVTNCCLSNSNYLIDVISL